MTTVGAEQTFDNVWRTIALDETLISGVEGTLRATAVATSRGASELLAGLPRLAAGDLGDAGADLELSSVLGVGGMGVVRLARQRSLGREVAVKTLKPDVSDERAVVALVHEASIAGSLEHPNIVPVHALGRSERDGPMLVMKRVAGVSLHELLHDDDHAAWARVEGDRLTFALEVLMQVCNAAHFAHSRGVVHRDIKSENVMIGEFGEVYLLDWGVACDVKRAAPSEASAAIVGTPVYMAPEMLKAGARVDARTDVYLLGGLLHEVLTRRPRHAGATLYDVLHAAFDSAPAAFDASVPRELAAICNRATSADPAQRFPTALALRQAISEFLRHRSSHELADEAHARLEELAAIVQSSNRAGDELRVHKLFAECRFGFQQALRAWADNPRAVTGLERAITTMIEHELARRDATAAAVLLAELGEPHPDLDARVAALRDELREEGRDVERLRAMAREMDPAVASRQRAAGAVALGVGLSTALLFVARLVRRGVLPLSHASISATVAACATVLAIAMIVARRVVFQNRYNRTLMIAFALAAAGILVSEACLALLGAPPSAGMTVGFLVMAMSGAHLAAAVDRWFGVAGAQFLAGAVASAVLPRYSVDLAALTLLMSHSTVAAVWYRESLAPAKRSV